MVFLAQVGKLLDLAPGQKAQVVRELASHHAELQRELLASGMDAASAEQEADRRMGDPAEVAAQLSPIHNASTWKSALLAAVPYLVLAALTFALRIIPCQLAIDIPMGLAGLVFTAVSVWQLVRGKRSIWIASWLAASFAFLGTAVDGLVTIIVPSGWVLQASRLSVSGLYSLAMVAVLWDSRQFREPAIILGVVGLMSNLLWRGELVSSWLAILPVGMSLVRMCLPVLFAVHLFSRHPHGNAAQASMFILGANTLRHLCLPENQLDYVVLLAAVAFCVVILARSSTIRSKVVAVVAAVMAVMLWRALFTPEFFGVARVMGLSGGPSFVLIHALPIAAMVLAPFLLEHIHSNRQRALMA